MHFVESYRVVVFTPVKSVEKLLKAVRKITSLQYGNYVGVSWTSAVGEERFTPIEGSSPTIGTKGVEQLEAMCRVEFSVPRDKTLLIKVISDAVYPNHDWEEPVISVTPVMDVQR